MQIFFLRWKKTNSAKYLNGHVTVGRCLKIGMYLLLHPYSQKRDKSWIDLGPFRSLKFVEKYKPNIS